MRNNTEEVTVTINFVDLYSEGDLIEFSSMFRLFWPLLFRGVP
jgi:hypothetical protein